MKALQFTISIQAPRQRIWDTMLAPDTYRIWTAEFMEGSYYEGSWEQGARIRFLAPNGHGMVSVIAESRPPEFLSIQHLGMIKNGVEDTDSAEVRSWAPAFENYLLTETDGVTEVQVMMNVMLDFEDYLIKTWPKALAKLKTICESAAD